MKLSLDEARALRDSARVRRETSERRARVFLDRREVRPPVKRDSPPGASMLALRARDPST